MLLAMAPPTDFRFYYAHDDMPPLPIIFTFAVSPDIALHDTMSPSPPFISRYDAAADAADIRRFR